MKYGIVISVSKTKFGPVVFRGNLKENIKKAASMGYDGIELALRKPEELKVGEVKNLISEYGLEVIAVGTGQIYGEEGLNFSDHDRAVRDAAVERVKDIIDIANYFNSSIIIGLVRGNIVDMENYSRELLMAERNIAECLQRLLDYSHSECTKFLLEPINRYETNIFNRLEDIERFLESYREKLDMARLGILADTFHMNIEEPVIEESFKKYFNLIKHIHFADSNRWAPGYGHIEFGKIFKILKETGYKDFISFEMLPLPDPGTSARKALEFVKKY